MQMQSNPQTYYDQRGHPLLLESKLGEGAEGSIYRVVGATKGCVKILERSRRTAERLAKIEAMIEARPGAAVMQASTWPMATVYEDARCTHFAGFVMARLDMKSHDELHIVWDPKSPFGLSERSTIALNLAAVITEVHAAGHCIGDLRERNVLVNRRRCEIVLVDCDSFEVHAPSGAVFHCGVGVGDYLPPELLAWMDVHGTSLAGVERYHSDLYALAVLVFQLFMNGTRPYSARGAAITPELASAKAKAIAGTYPYVDTGGQYLPPRCAPPMSLVPPPVRDLFTRAFVTGHDQPSARPSAAQWRDCLVEVVGQMQTCPHDRRHSYSNHLSGCPFCGALETQSSAPRADADAALTAPAPSNRWSTEAVVFVVGMLILAVILVMAVFGVV